MPWTATMLVCLSVLACGLELRQALWEWQRGVRPVRSLWRSACLPLAGSAMVYALTQLLATRDIAVAVQLGLTLLIVVPMGPLLYRLAYQPLADASVLVLLIVSVGVHLAMAGLGLVRFGAEGSRTQPVTDARYALGIFTISGQSLVVFLTAVLLLVALYGLFAHTLTGKALRATAVNRRGARLVGISLHQAGRLACTLAAGMGALCGVLVSPLITIYYDSGVLIGLKGFIGAIIGGLASYPLAATGAVLVGLLESVSSFWASALMAKPQLLMLDEPSLGLAPLHGREILHSRDLRQTGVATLLIEQNACAALQVADYGYVLETGSIALESPTAQLATDPRVMATYLGLRPNKAVS